MKRNRSLRIPILALILAGVTPSAIAADGALEINQDCVAVGCFAGDAPGFPVTINQPGTYVLTSDLAPPGSPGLDAIRATVAPVDIDLKGHSINGGATCVGTPVTGCTGAMGHVGILLSNGGNPGIFHIHNGTVRGFSVQDIAITDAGDGTVLERLTIAENAGIVALNIGGVTVASSVRVRDSQIVRNAGYGVAVDNPGARIIIENCSLIGNNYAGASLPSGGVLIGNRVNNNGNAVGGGNEGVICNAACALGQNTFQGNNGGPANAQWSIVTLLDMGGNVCLDHTPCP